MPTREEELCREFLPWAQKLAHQFARTQAGDQSAVCESDAVLAMLMSIRSWEPDAGLEMRWWIKRNVKHALVDGVRRRLGRVKPQNQEARAMFNNPDDLHKELPGKNGQTAMLHEMIPAPVAGDLTDFEQAEVRVDVTAMLPEMTPNQRATIGAVFWGGLNQREFSDQRGTGEAATSKLMQSALNKIRKTYAPV